MVSFRIALLFVVLVIPIWAQQQDTARDDPRQEATHVTDSNTASLSDSTALEPIKTVKADYPVEAGVKGIHGKVMIRVVVTEKGDVDTVEVISGDPVLAKPATDAARKWKFKPFIKNGKPVRAATTIPFDFALDASLTHDESKTGPPKDSETPVPRVRISNQLSGGRLVHKVNPVYPAEAREKHVQGTVLFQAVIGRDGKIKELNVTSGPVELVPAAYKAVKEWRYQPYELKGSPVEVETLIMVNFTLR